MPMPHKGHRIALTIRLPYDDYRQVAYRAKGRGWSLSQYVAYCVGTELGRTNRAAIRHSGGLQNLSPSVPEKLKSPSSYG